MGSVKDFMGDLQEKNHKYFNVLDSEIPFMLTFNSLNGWLSINLQFPINIEMQDFFNI